MSRGILVFIGIIILFIAGLLLVFPLQSQDIRSEPIQVPEPLGSYIVINGRIITVEIADTPETRKQGLMFRDRLPEDHGMLFVFESESLYSFWMMNMSINLDMIWIDSDGIIVHIERGVPACSQTCPSYQPDSPALYVLEMNSGFADSIGLEEGLFVEIFI